MDSFDAFAGFPLTPPLDALAKTKCQSLRQKQTLAEVKSEPVRQVLRTLLCCLCCCLPDLWHISGSTPREVEPR